MTDPPSPPHLTLRQAPLLQLPELCHLWAKARFIAHLPNTLFCLSTLSVGDWLGRERRHSCHGNRALGRTSFSVGAVTDRTRRERRRGKQSSALGDWIPSAGALAEHFIGGRKCLKSRALSLICGCGSPLFKHFHSFNTCEQGRLSAICFIYL